MVNKYSTAKEFDKKFIMFGSVLVLAIATILLFVNVTGGYFVYSLFNIIFIIISMLSIYTCKVKNDIDMSSNLLLMIVFFSALITVIIGELNNFNSLWLFMFPIAAVMLKGYKIGLWISIIFVILLIVILPIFIESVSIYGRINFTLTELAVIFASYHYEKYREELIDQLEVALISAESAAIHDAMTSLYNRRFFNEIFPIEIKRAYREKHLLGFFILDVDFFKQFNDTYGHKAGDLALISVADICKKVLKRAEDYIFRLGGEEFGGIIRGNSSSDIIAIVDSVRASIENEKIMHQHNSASDFLTVSIGLIIIDGETVFTEDQIYLKADEALYESKNSGRNRLITV